MKNQFFQHTHVATRCPPDATKPMVRTDNLFLAVALLVVDTMLKTAHEASQDTLVFKRYFALFPQTQPKSLREFVRQRMISPIRAQRFLNGLAYALRQIVADRLIAFPETYYPVFYRDRQQLMEKHLRDMDEALPVAVLHVLAQALGVHIQLTYSEWGKEIPSQYHYGNAQYETHHLIYADGFYGVKPQHRELLSLPVLNAQALEVMPCMAQHDDERLKRQLEAEALRLLTAYMQHAQRLFAMEKAQELEPSDLQRVYIFSLSNGKTAAIAGLEQGTQAFFCQLFMQMTPPMHAALSSMSQGVSPVAKELVFALSRAIALGVLDEKTVYDALEQPCAPLNRARMG